MLPKTTKCSTLLTDVYSFDEEEAVLDPHIAEHLSHFGIDMLKMQRVRFFFFKFLSESSWFETFILTKQLSVCPHQTQNGHHTDNHVQPRATEWEQIQESGLKLKAVYGSGYTGIKNLGNSCYLSTTMQVLFSIPEFQRA